MTLIKLFLNILGSYSQNKKYRDNYRYSEYFRNLNYSEILNLIFLTDFKCFLTLQSSFALFLQKNNSISNLYSLLNLSNEKSENKHINNLYLKDSCTEDITSNIYNNNYNTGFFDSIRILPDLKLLPRKLHKSELNDTHCANHRILEKPIGQSKLLKVQIKNVSSTLPNNQNTKEQTHKKKKQDTIVLSDQLKPVLDSLKDLNLPITVDFQFTLRGILLESALFVNVFEDVPLSLFKNNMTKNATSNYSKTTSSYEINSIKQIQNLFFMNIDEHLKKLDGFHLCQKSKTMSAQSPSSACASSSDEPKSFESINKELKNALILKLK